MPKNVLEVRTSRLLGVEIEGIEKYIMDLCMERKTVMKEIEGEIRIYPSRFLLYGTECCPYAERSGY